MPGEDLARAVLPPLDRTIRPFVQRLPRRLTAPAAFTFLGQALDFGATSQIDWCTTRYGKLWRYNLHYFEYLRQPDLPEDTGHYLIAAWINAADEHTVGWEPYPLSLRLVNWLQFYRAAGRPPSTKATASLAQQYLSLTRKIEYHLGGNHLLENALALAVGARFFRDERGISFADRLLRQELREQYLPDGGHYERSVMYHLILLWRQLDVYSWLAADDALRAILRASLQDQLGWAASICTADGRYPHFNDSTPGIAPAWADALAYARALGLEPAYKPLTASGYRRWSYDGADCWLDVGNIGPDYIPGHAHADNLTFCLHLAGQPYLVDPAVSTYEKNARRTWERSTPAHNTVSPAGRNSSDVWGGFRVGRRTRTTILSEEEGRVILGQHQGYGTPHRRRFSAAPGALLLEDTFPKGTAYFHFDYRQEPEIMEKGVRCGKLQLTWEGAEALRLGSYEQAVGFNALRTAKSVEIDFNGKLTTKLLW